ncbi:hypothetical protein TWF788_007497 [Orbilia oligospora]|uniref:Peptidase S8/S53 domain-containing protein n=1 Tax=Orbilia oligospora TaxID=2813651 RepID=A0A7C8U4A3_ORBOL|nr:hypothetical protein TWF788_007497 [Orbilia oligospora]
MARLSVIENSGSDRCSARTAAFLAQMLFASGMCATQPSFEAEAYHSPINSSSPIDDQKESQDVRDMAAAYLASGIIVLSLIASFYRKHSARRPAKVIRTFRKRAETKSFCRPTAPKHHRFFQLETLDYRRPDHSDKIAYWELYQQNCLEPFKPKDITEDDNFHTNVLLIDSGIDVTHTTIDLQKEDGLIQPWRDYTDDTSDTGTSSSLEDEFGHGTSGAHIIVTIAQSAVVYSARVCKSDSTDVDPLIVAKAINDAVENQGSVEKPGSVKFQFIIMPLGFPEGTKGLDVLKIAIENASKKGITLIAAAGNEGNCKNPAPPACYPEVLCALSCDGNGTPSGFSPSIQINAEKKTEFLVPGEGIECAWIEPGKCHRQQRFPEDIDPLGPDEKGGFTYVSGTSFACSVLGGISINILERLYEVATRDCGLDVESAKEAVDRVRRDHLIEILGRMERPERRAYLLVPTQVTNEVLKAYLEKSPRGLTVSS